MHTVSHARSGRRLASFGAAGLLTLSLLAACSTSNTSPTVSSAATKAAPTVASALTAVSGSAGASVAPGIGTSVASTITTGATALAGSSAAAGVQSTASAAAPTIASVATAASATIAAGASGVAGTRTTSSVVVGTPAVSSVVSGTAASGSTTAGTTSGTSAAGTFDFAKFVQANQSVRTARGDLTADFGGLPFTGTVEVVRPDRFRITGTTAGQQITHVQIGQKAYVSLNGGAFMDIGAAGQATSQLLAADRTLQALDPNQTANALVASGAGSVTPSGMQACGTGGTCFVLRTAMNGGMVTALVDTQTYQVRETRTDLQGGGNARIVYSAYDTPITIDAP